MSRPCYTKKPHTALVRVVVALEVQHAPGTDLLLEAVDQAVLAALPGALQQRLPSNAKVRVVVEDVEDCS